jgi:molybdopterin-guanine dinucleotide biosynthesis protein A
LGEINAMTIYRAGDFACYLFIVSGQRVCIGPVTMMRRAEPIHWGFTGERRKGLLELVIERARPQVARLLLNADGDSARFSAFRLPVASDTIGRFAGPLAGILTGLEWASTDAPDCWWVASFATDTPFFPRDLVPRLRTAVQAEGAAAACAASAGRLHPVFALWPVRLAPALRDAMEREGLRKAEDWTKRCRVAVVEFSTSPVDPFFNVNRSEDLAEAERLLGGQA